MCAHAVTPCTSKVYTGTRLPRKEGHKWNSNLSRSPKDRYAPTPKTIELFALVDAHRRSSPAVGGNDLRFGRGYAAPAFEPHVTLAGGIVGPARALAAKVRELARRIPPFTVRLTAVDGLDEYFRCLFVRVATTHPIMTANKAAREVFHLEKQPAFMPHLSLLYGNLPASVKERIIASLGRQFDSSSR